MNNINFLLVVSLLLISPFANSSIITEIWTAEVGTLSNNSIYSTSTNTSYNGFFTGDIVSWTVTYQSDPSDSFTRYNDGLNGIAERGKGDDTLNTKSCLYESISSDCGSSLIDNGFTALYDSYTDVSNIYNPMLSFLQIGESEYDYFDYNEDTRLFRTSPYPDFTALSYIADH